MHHTRRDFLQTALAGGAAVTFPAAAATAMAMPRPRQSKPEAADRPLSILILGGTSFVGPHIVEYARSRGHTITLFNRGRTNPGLFPDVEKLKGDRDPRKDDGLKALEGDRRWDCVVDTSGYYPRIVDASASLLAQRSEQYVFISSISVYSDNSIVNMDESGPIGTIEDPTVETMGDQFQNYGPLKALCEQAAERAMSGRATNIRPGLIVGPRDNVPRFTYWPVRVERGGEVLAPGTPNDPVQYIDGRDLAEFIVTCLENRTTGYFNATGPNTPTTIAETLYGCKAITGGDATFTWVNADFLETQRIQPWAHMPLWIPPRDGNEGFHRVNIERAIEAGLRSRPLGETVADTLAWYHEVKDEQWFRMRGGISPQREAEVLEAWRARES